MILTSPDQIRLDVGGTPMHWAHPQEESPHLRCASRSAASCSSRAARSRCAAAVFSASNAALFASASSKALRLLDREEQLNIYKHSPYEAPKADVAQ